MLKISSINLSLQALTLVSKSLLLLVLARYLSVAELGTFGILVVTLGLAMYLLGMDFYVFNTREILAREPAEAPRLLRDQLVFHVLCYSLALPLLLLIFQFGMLPWRLSLLFVTLSRPVKSAVQLSVRSGVWVSALPALLILEPGFRTVEIVCLCWIAASALSVAISLYWLLDLPWHQAWSAPIDWRWIRRGLAVCLPFLGSSLAVRGILTLDRYALQHFSGAEAVGVYTFYSNAYNAVQAFVDMGVLFILRPRIIAAYQKGLIDEYRSLMRRLSWAVSGLVVVLCLAAALAIYPLLMLVESPIYGEHLGVYWIVLAMAVVTTLGEIPHTALYVRRQDRVIVGATFLGLAAALVLNLALVPGMGLMGAAVATLLAMAVVGLAKTWWLVRTPDQ